MATAMGDGKAVGAALVLVLAAALSGCLDRGGQGDALGADWLTLTFVGIDAPAGLEGAVLTMTVDHLALFDEEREEWVPLLGDATVSEVVLEPGYGDPSILDVLPVQAGNYSAAEIVVRDAVATGPEGDLDVAVEEVACYAAVTMVLAGVGGDAELTLYLSGPDALVRSGGGGWVFRPALVGSLASGEDEVAFSEPDCRALGV